MRPIMAEAWCVCDRLAMQEQRWQDAEGAVEETLTLARAMPSPYAEARALYLYGQLHARRGEPERTRERLAAALGILSPLGERLYDEQAERALAEME